MIQIEQVPYIPKLEYGDYAWKELQMSAGAIETVTMASEGIWVVTDEVPLMVCGVIRSSLLSRPRFWFLLCKAFTESRVNYHLKSLRHCVDALEKYYPVLETCVEQGWETGERFAKFCRFKKTDRTVEIYGKKFSVWEK